jgi:hypothetical protein
MPQGIGNCTRDWAGVLMGQRPWGRWPIMMRDARSGRG